MVLVVALILSKGASEVNHNNPLRQCKRCAKEELSPKRQKNSKSFILIGNRMCAKVRICRPNDKNTAFSAVSLAKIQIIMKHVCSILLILIGLQHSEAQVYKTNTAAVLLPHLNFSFQWPGQDLATRFGANNAVGVGLDYMTSKNWILGVEGTLTFGPNVKEDVISNLRDKDGQVLGNDRYFAEVSLKQRGYYASLFFGKLWSVSKRNKRSGIKTSIGAGYMQHNVRVQDNTQTIPQVSSTYISGYDRLSRGFQTNQFVGYQYLGTNRRINFQIGFEFVQGFTKGRRDFLYDVQRSDNVPRKDFMTGFKLGWVVPIYRKSEEEIYY